jgi:hypothetical protein
LSKWRLSQGLKRLALDILPRDDAGIVDQNRRRRRPPKTDFPPDIEGFFEAPLPSYQRFPRLSKLLRADDRSRALDLEPETIVAYLEDKLDPLTGE